MGAPFLIMRSGKLVPEAAGIVGAIGAVAFLASFAPYFEHERSNEHGNTHEEHP